MDVRRTTGAGATLACLVAFLSLSACRDALRLDEAFLAQEGEATRAAFERVALPLPAGLAFRLVDAKTLEETLLQEFQRQARGEEWTAAKTEQAAREASVRVALRYDPVANEVRVAAENFERAALEAEAPLAGEDAVRGLLLRECGRAYADRRFELTTRVKAAATQEDVAALGLLSAGIAEFAARKAARASGREGALERSIALLAGTSQEGERAARILETAERLVTERFEEGGEAAIERLLDHPREAIGAPERGPLDAVVDRLVAKRPTLEARRFQVPPAELRRSLSFLPEATVDRIVEGLVEERAVAFGDRDHPDDMSGGYVRLHRSPEEARYLVDAVREAFETQEDARVEPREGAGWAGFFALPAALEDARAESALVASGSLTILVFHSRGFAIEDLVSELDELVAVVPD